jgi:hypothetical protein
MAQAVLPSGRIRLSHEVEKRIAGKPNKDPATKQVPKMFWSTGQK